MLFSSYIAAFSYLGKKYTRPYPKGSPRNTRMWRERLDYGKDVYIRYHYTCVVTYTPDYMLLKSGGWQTVTTKRRMNDAIGGALYQYHKQWYVVDRVTGQHVPYFDGIQIDYDGHILNNKADDQLVLGVTS